MCGERVEKARDRTPKMLADDSVEATLDLVQVESSLPSTAVRVRARFPGSERARLPVRARGASVRRRAL